MNAFNFDFRNLACLFRCHHLASEPAHSAVSRSRISIDPLLFEKSDFNSSSFYCCHFEGGANMRPSLPALLFRAQETTKQAAEKSGNKSEINRN
jgi:hypothetical protein